jgi:protein-disulfide isomerase
MTISKRDEIKAQRTKRKRQRRIYTFLGAGGGLVLLILIIAFPTIYQSLKPIVRITPIAYSLVDGKAVGNPNAKVKIVIYEDFQCPYCKIYTESTEKQLLESSYISSGEVYYVFMQYPFVDTSSKSKESHQAANASMCALEQGRFWDYHSMLYANQGTENGGSFKGKKLQAFAEALGLDMTAFNQCFNTNKYSAEIEADFQTGTAAGVTGTPTIFLNGTIIGSGVPSYDGLKSAIDTALASGG